MRIYTVLSALACAVSVSACMTLAPQAPHDAVAPQARAQPEKSDVEETAEVAASQQTVCDLVCERAELLPRPSPATDYTAKETEDVNRALDAIHPELLACYAKRIKANPLAHGFITVDIVIGSTGEVVKLETTGGAILGQATMDCIVSRIKQVKLAPPHGGGTLEVNVPFSLRPAGTPDDSI